MLAPEQLVSTVATMDKAAGLAASTESASLASLTLKARAQRLGLSAGALVHASLSSSPLVQDARAVTG